MNLSRVKTYIIITLVVANAILAGLFMFRLFDEEAAKRQANEELIGLLSKQGIIVSELPAETAFTLVLSRDLNAERAAATAALGETDMRELGVGVVYQYQNENGVATFRGGERFEISFNNGAVYSGDERGKACRELMKKMGYLNISENYDEEKTDAGVTLTFWQHIESAPLYNARAVFEFSDEGQLLSMSGLLALGSAQTLDRTQCKSAGAALLLFSVNNDAVVESVELGYRLKAQTFENPRLVPEWRVDCGDEEFYLDGYTGAVVTADD